MELRNALIGSVDVMAATEALLPLCDPRVAKMQVVESGECLLMAAGLNPAIVVDQSALNESTLGYKPIFLVRESVALRLIQAVKHLMPT